MDGASFGQFNSGAPASYNQQYAGAAGAPEQAAANGGLEISAEECQRLGIPVGSLWKVPPSASAPPPAAEGTAEPAQNAPQQQVCPYPVFEPPRYRARSHGVLSRLIRAGCLVPIVAILGG